MGKTIAERGALLLLLTYCSQRRRRRGLTRGKKCGQIVACGTKMSCLAYILQVGVSLIEL